MKGTMTPRSPSCRRHASTPDTATPPRGPCSPACSSGRPGHRPVGHRRAGDRPPPGRGDRAGRVRSRARLFAARPHRRVVADRARPESAPAVPGTAYVAHPDAYAASRRHVRAAPAWQAAESASSPTKPARVLPRPGRRTSAGAAAPRPAKEAAWRSWFSGSLRRATRRIDRVRMLIDAHVTSPVIIDCRGHTDTTPRVSPPPHPPHRGRPPR